MPKNGTDTGDRYKYKTGDRYEYRKIISTALDVITFGVITAHGKAKRT